MSEKEKTLLKQLAETAKQLPPSARDVLTAYAQGMAADKLSVYDRSGTEVPEKLLFVWDYEKDRSVEDVAAVRMMLSACR